MVVKRLTAHPCYRVSRDWSSVWRLVRSEVRISPVSALTARWSFPQTALVHGSGLCTDSPLPPGCFHSTLTESGIPRLVIVLRILQARLTSTR